MKILADKVNSKYGAPMGRCSYTLFGNGESIYTALSSDARVTYLIALQGMPLRFRLQDARLDSSGYDRGGAYWGHSGQGRVYLAESVDGCVFRSFRAHSRASAAQQLRREFPHARVSGIVSRIDKRDPRYVVQRVQRNRIGKMAWYWRVTFHARGFLQSATGDAVKIAETEKLADALSAANEFDAERNA